VSPRTMRFNRRLRYMGTVSLSNALQSTATFGTAICLGPHSTNADYCFSREDSEPAFSSDGKRIAFGSSRSGANEIYVSAADGSNPVQLTSLNNGATGSPAWSPDGTQIAFDSRAAGQGDIYVISPEGGSPRRLTHRQGDSTVPSWSRDGRWIYFQSDRPGAPMWKVPSQGGEPVLISEHGGNGVWESSDGKTLYYYRDGTVWRCDLSGKNETPLINAPDFQNFRVCGKDICILDRSTAHGRFIRYDPVTKQKQTKNGDFGPQFDASSGMDVSPDGRWIIYSRGDSVDSDIMLVENFHSNKTKSLAQHCATAIVAS
jgi:Tol biopolymer transport system component